MLLLLTAFVLLPAGETFQLGINLPPIVRVNISLGGGHGPHATQTTQLQTTTLEWTPAPTTPTQPTTEEWTPEPTTVEQTTTLAPPEETSF